MAKQRALGMGLDALIKAASTTSSTPTPNTGINEEIRMDLIDVNPYQPRNEFDETALQDLSESIRLLGIIQPITVCKSANGRYQLISGERRFRAAQMAGLETIPAYQRVGDDNRQILLMALEENLQREDLDAIDVALAYQRLIDEFQYTQEELSSTVSKKRSTIANFLRLLRLPPEIQFAIKKRAISMGHAKALINIQDPAAQLHLLDEIIRQDLSVRKVEEMVAHMEEDKKKVIARKKPALTPWMTEAKSKLAQRLQTQIDVKSDSQLKGGKIVIAFQSKDDLERILDKIQ